MLILVCNVGSTSLKYKLFNMPDETILVEAKTERVGRTDAIFTYRNHCSGYSEKLENLDIPNTMPPASGFSSAICSAKRADTAERSRSLRPSASKPSLQRAITACMS